MPAADCDTCHLKLNDRDDNIDMPKVTPVTTSDHQPLFQRIQKLQPPQQQQQGLETCQTRLESW